MRVTYISPWFGCNTLCTSGLVDDVIIFSHNFANDRFLMKLFSTSNMEIITYCREVFNVELPSVILARHTSLFLDKLRHCDNCLIKNVMRT